MKFYTLSSGAGADFYDFGGEFDANGLGGEDAPFVFYDTVQEAGSVLDDRLAQRGIVPRWKREDRLAAAGGAQEDDFCEVVVHRVEFLREMVRADG